MKITPAMIAAACRVLGNDVPEDTVRTALEAALSAAPTPKGGPPDARIDVADRETPRVSNGKKVAVPKAVVWTRKPRPRR
jgi:hypothetical protein